MRKGGTTKGKGPEMELDHALVAKAVSALLKYHNEKVAKNENERQSLPLLGNDGPVQVQFGLEVAPDRSRKVIRIDIPNSFHQTSSHDGGEGLDEPDVCLIVKDESKPWIQEMVEEHSEHTGCVKKVLTLDSLRKKHGSFQQRRELMKKYDVFMADDRILPMLTSALGNDFVKSNKLPIPITITRKAALPFAIQRNLSATYLTMSQGTSITIRAGTTGMGGKKLVENILTIARSVPGKIPRGLSNIRNIAVKTPDSASLPFYHKVPEELAEIAKLAGISPAFKPLGDADAKKDEDYQDANKSKKDAIKSPLVRALKKQKHNGNETETKHNKKAESSDKKRPKEKSDSAKKRKMEDELSEEFYKKAKNITDSAKKHKKDSKNSNEVVEKKTKDETNSENNRKKEKEDKSPATSGKTPNKDPGDRDKKRKMDKVDRPTKSAKSDKETKNNEQSVSEENAEFIASKKFKGSKEGYVFRSGKEGIGYYIDKKPVVDKMMIQALMRSSGGGSKRGRSSSVSAKKRKGRR